MILHRYQGVLQFAAIGIVFGCPPLIRAVDIPVSQRTAVCDRRSSDARALGDVYWQKLETENFLICYPTGFDAVAVAKECERWRADLVDFWLGPQAAHETWSDRCNVVLHPGKATYVQSAGRGSEETYGCSTVKQSDGRIVSRRIDLRLDRNDPIRRVLPHELTHVVLAEIISRSKTPHWADEGMALMADLPSKQEGHERDLATGLQEHTVYRLIDLLTTNDYPGSKPQVFYGESLSLTRFLVSRGSPAKFLAFLEASADTGYDVALRQHFGIRDVPALEQLWLQSFQHPECTGHFSIAAR